LGLLLRVYGVINIKNVKMSFLRNDGEIVDWLLRVYGGLRNDGEIVDLLLRVYGVINIKKM
jgi:hypothetical protein